MEQQKPAMKAERAGCYLVSANMKSHTPSCQRGLLCKLESCHQNSFQKFHGSILVFTCQGSLYLDYIPLKSEVFVIVGEDTLPQLFFFQW